MVSSPIASLLRYAVLWTGACCVAGCNGVDYTQQSVPPVLGDSPQAAVAHLQHAMEWREYGNAMGVIALPDRARYSRYFALLEGENKDWEKLGGAIRKRFGWGTVLERAVLEATSLSPLQRQTRNGVIDWTSLQFTKAEGDPNKMIVRDLNGRYLVELVHFEGKWYVKDFDGGSCSAEYMPTLERQVEYFRDRIASLINVVREKPTAEVETEVYEALGQPVRKAGNDRGHEVPASSTTKKNPDPILDD
jgi:hypothetical protein